MKNTIGRAILVIFLLLPCASWAGFGFGPGGGWHPPGGASDGQMLAWDSATNSVVWTTGTGTGDLLAANNLSDVADLGTAQANLHIDSILTALGLADDATHFGLFTGTTIADNQTAKAAIQALETAVEGKVTTDTGNAGTATALAADPTGCAGGQVTTDINASGTASCTAWSANVLTLLGADTYATFLSSLGAESATSNDIDPDRLAGDTTDDNLIDAAIVATLNQNTTGSAATLTTARNIGDASFNGSANIAGDAILDNEDLSPTGGTWNLSALTALTLPNFSTGGSSAPAITLADTDADATGTGKISVDALTAGQDSVMQLTVDDSAGEDTVYVEIDGVNEDVEINKTLAMGANSITMTGSLAATGARVTKGWFTDIESTNAPTVGGTSIFTSQAHTSPTITTGITPTSADGAALGSASAEFSDLYLAAGGVIYGENDQANSITSSATGWTFAKPLTVANVTNDNHLKLTDNAGGRAPTASSYELYSDAGVWKLNQNGTEYAAVLSPTAGQVSFTGPTAARAYALPDAATTILTTNAVITPSQGGTGIANNDASTLTIFGAFGTTVTVSATTGITLPPVSAGTVDTHCTATHDYGAAAVAWSMTAAEAACTYVTATNANGAVDAVLPAATPGKTYTVNNATGQVLTFKVTGQTGGTIANAKWGFYTTLAADVAEIYELP